MLRKVLPVVARAANRAAVVAPSQTVALSRATPALSLLPRRFQSGLSGNPNATDRGTAPMSPGSAVGGSSGNVDDLDDEMDFDVGESSELPTKVYGIHGRYASALYLAAADADQIQEVYAEYEAFIAALDERIDIQEEILNPTVATAEKLKEFRELAQEIELSELFSGFLSTLIENGRMQEYRQVFKLFEELVKADEGIVDAKIVLAEERSAEDVEKIASTIGEKYLEEWQTLEYEVEVDPSIIGGFKVYFEDNLVDLSLATRIAEVKTAVEEGADPADEEEFEEEEEAKA